MARYPHLPGSALVAWLAGVLCAVGLTLCLLWLALGGRYTLDSRLNRAACAVAGQGSASRRPVLIRTGKGIVELPAGVHFDRERAIRLAFEFRRLQRQAESVLTRRRARPLEEPDVVQVAAASIFARDRIAGFLKVDSRRAQVIAYALGWPWVGRDPAFLTAQDAARVQGGRRCPLAGMSVAEWERLLELAREAPAWPAARQRLQSEFGLSPEQAFAVRCELCRRGVEAAFASAAGVERAAEALGKYAAMAPAQAETVLAMHGALELVQAGPEATGALEVLAREHPRLVEHIRHAALAGRARNASGEAPVKPVY